MKLELKFNPLQIVKLIKRSKKEEVPESISLDEEEPLEEGLGEFDEEVEESESEDDETISNIIERLNEIDNRLPRVDVTINNLKREIGDLREDLSKLDESMKDMMALYEIVSAQINPFVGSSKVTSLSIERLDEMERRIEELEFLIEGLSHDIKMVFRKTLNIKDIVNKVLYEEVLS
jgi:flagellar protein FlaC